MERFDSCFHPHHACDPHPNEYHENIHYTPDQINALLGLIPYKADRAEVPKMETLSDVNYIGHVATSEALPDKMEQPSWALVGSVKETKPYFYYVEGFVPKGYRAGWNDLSDVLGTYDLTVDKVSIFDYNLLTEYNVSRNHTQDTRIFSHDWKEQRYFSAFPDYVEGKKYRPCDRVNMPGYTKTSFVAQRSTSEAPFVVKKSNVFTFEDAIALVPEEYRIPGMKVTFVSAYTNQAETWYFKGNSASLWKDKKSWWKIDLEAERNEIHAEEVFIEKMEAPEMVADRAIADENGNRIPDTYLTRKAVRRHIEDAFNDMFIDNPPTVMDGMITPEMLSESTKQLIGNKSITNFADDEDITSVHGQLKLANKRYDPNNYSGKGRRYLRKNLVAGRNILTQSMMCWSDTIYVIQYNYDLDGDTIEIPENSVLEFHGGHIANGIVKINGTLLTGIQALKDGISCTVTGTYAIGQILFIEQEDNFQYFNGQEWKMLGRSPFIKNMDNKLYYSYNNKEWFPCSEYIAAWFRFQNNKFQISRDNSTWSDLSEDITNSLHIKAYVTDKSQYPTPKQGDMIMVGPTYAADDTEHTKPIYRLHVYNANGWVDNGPFQSIAAGVVQELGDSETKVISQKIVSEKFSEFEEIIQFQNLYPKLRLNRGYYINVNNEKNSDRETSTNYAFKVVAGEVIIYRGNYGGACPAINFYNNGEIISSITKTDLGVDTTIEIVVPKGADSAIANSFNTDVNVIFKDGAVQRLQQNVEDLQQNVDGLSESNKLLESKDNALTLIVGKEANIKVGWINVNGQILTNKGLYTEIAVEEGDTFSYYGSYGGSCAGYIIYDNNNSILVKKEKADLGNISEDIEIPENGVLLKSCSFTDTFNITYKGSIKEKIDKLKDLSSNLSLYPLNSTNLVKGKYVTTSGTLNANEKASYLEFLIKEGDVISYEGNYGGSCAGIAYYDVNNTLISVEQKVNLGNIKTEFTAPTNSYKAIASTYNNDLIVYYKDGLRGVLNEKLKTDDFAKYYHYQSLYEKFDFSKLTFNSRDIAVNQAILFSAWVPKNGHENDEIYLIALSAYYNESLDTQEPTRYDIWVYNQTVRVDVLQYINKTPSTQDRYHIVYKDTEYGTLYMIVDTSILAPYKENNKYKAIIWGPREYKIKTRDANDPFLSDTLWNKEDVPVTKDYKIVWYGTSIPAGGYPLIVGTLLGCTVYNEAVGESLVRLGWGKNCIAEGDEIDIWGCSSTDTGSFNPMSNTITALAKSMSASKAEKRYLLDNLTHFENITGSTLNREVQTDEVIMGYSYEEKLLKYIDSSREDYTPVDLIVFDHGHNDLNPDGDPKWDTYDIANRDKANYWGAMNFLMDIIRKYNPHQNICQISHYQGNVDYSANFYKAQQQFAEHWGIPFMELYKLTQMSTSEQVRTSGYWGYTDGVWHNDGFIFIDNGDGTYTTNQSCIIQYDFGFGNGTYNQNTQLFTSNVLESLPGTTQARDIKDIDGVKTCLLKPREMYMKDRLHPVSDKSGKANTRIATLLACWLKSIFVE